ncbi:MAG: 3-hydroxyacyl-CoA dehydrogenase NAD-binding domain-containing protein [bacterium]
MSVFSYEKDADGIVTVTMDMTGPVNSMNQEFRDALAETIDKLEAEENITGVVITSAKKVFVAGADLRELLGLGKEQLAGFLQMVGEVKSLFRRLEMLPVPVVAAINGAALGGGYELTLACNYRIAADVKGVQVGLPEVSLGVLPGGGGIVRMINMFGFEKAAPLMLQGTKLRAPEALAAGLVNETVDSVEALVPRAKAWIIENQDSEDAALQPWDKKGHKIPGGDMLSPKVNQTVAGAVAMVYKETRGLMPAPIQILDVAVNAMRVDFETAMGIESRCLAYLLGTPQAKNLITFFFQMTGVGNGSARPDNIEPQPTKKVGVLGAGMMGQGIAYVSAMAGIEVILKDLDVEAANKGKAYSEKLLAKRVAKGRMSQQQMDQVLGLIKPTASDDDLQGCDLIIEAVFENMDLKKQMTASTEQCLVDGGVWGSNTSTLPITQLAEASANPENFIGIHFFSPVDKMPLVEIIVGEKTSDAALAKAFDYARQIRKTPIVVNDSLGFYTSRTFTTYIDEGVRAVMEGIHPVKVDNLGKAIGMPVGPLTVHDEVSQELTRKAMETWDDMGVGDKWGEQDAVREMIRFMIEEHSRGGKYHGGGYFEYAADGSKTIWPGLVDKYYDPDVVIPDQDIKDRLLFRQVIEALKCLETNVLRSVAEGNIGSVMGIGAPPWTGGFLQFVNTYGLQQFAERCDELAATYGERFRTPAIVRERMASGIPLM